MLMPGHNMPRQCVTISSISRISASAAARAIMCSRRGAAHMESARMATQKWPEAIEAIEAIEEFPRTLSGKVKKVELRNRLRNQAK